MGAMLLAMDNTIADPSVFSGKKALANLQDYDTIILANKTMSNAASFYKQAKSNNIKPVLGVQAVVDNVLYLFIAHNHDGYQFLCACESGGFNEDVFSNPSITSICLDVFNTDVTIKSKYGSLLDDCTPLGMIKNSIIQEATEVIDAPIVNARSPKDYYSIACLKAIEDKTTLAEEVRGGRVKAVVPKELSHPVWNEILNKCVDDYTFGNPVPPNFKFTKEVSAKLAQKHNLPEAFAYNTDDNVLLEQLCRIGLKERGFEGNQVYEDRLNFELEVIKNMKFAGYFLIVWDFINFAKRNEIPVGPGRGSAAGSLAVYCLHITNLDPIPYNLLFERFLNPNRVSFPDIDIDFCQSRRDEVIEYVTKQYGADNVGQVITFGTLAAKVAVKDSTRVLNLPDFLGVKLSAMIPETPGIKLDEAYELSKNEFDALFETDHEAKLVWETAKSIEGLKRHNGVHACGLVISNDPIPTKAPLYDIKDARVVGYDGEFLEYVDLVKFDFLGLKTLTVCDNAVKAIREKLGVSINLFNLDLKDRNIYKYISSGQTLGMFQIESPGMQSLASNLQPNSFEDLTAMIALYRPGPMDAGLLESFVKRKKGTEEIIYFNDELSPALKPILEPTYGVIVYQEQVIQIVQVIAGFSLGEADLVRRAMGKKKKEEMDAYAQKFVDGAVQKGYKAEDAANLFALIEKFAGYGFNKSHSAAYAVITYYTAYLKYYYPDFFFAALFNSELSNNDALAGYIGEARRMGLTINKPDLTSKSLFDVVSPRVISFGLQAIKGIGSKDLDLSAFVESKSIFEILSVTQFDGKKEEATLQRQLSAAQKKIVSFDNQIGQTEEKIRTNQQKRITDAVAKTLNSLSEKMIDLQVKREEKAQEAMRLEYALKELESKEQIGEKLNKTVFEALVETGVFDKLGHTRKDLLENTTSLLNIATHGSVVMSGEEFTKDVLLDKEIQRTGFVLSQVFANETLKELSRIKIPEGTIIAALLGTEERKTRTGKTFFEVSMLLPNGEIKKLSDFNGAANGVSSGEICAFETKTNDKGYTNLFKVSLFDANKFEVKKVATKVIIGQSNINFNADRIEVYDNDGSLVAILTK